MSEVEISGLAFPVLCLSRDNSIVPAESPESLTTCTAAAFFRGRYYERLLIIDSNTESFFVLSADPVAHISAPRRALVRALNRRMHVHLRLESANASSLANAKAVVSSWLERAPDFWEASYDLAEWKQRVASAATMRELIELFC